MENNTTTARRRQESGEKCENQKLFSSFNTYYSLCRSLMHQQLEVVHTFSLKYLFSTPFLLFNLPIHSMGGEYNSLFCDYFSAYESVFNSEQFK